VNQTRSYARYGYHDPIKERPNYHLLIGHKAEKILFTEDMSVKGVVIYDRTLPEEKFNVKANKETIIATGAAHTPQLLELSGVGDPAVLKAAGIEVKAELPGVGNNFQDHPQARIICNCASASLLLFSSSLTPHSHEGLLAELCDSPNKRYFLRRSPRRVQCSQDRTTYARIGQFGGILPTAHDAFVTRYISLEATGSGGR
jgi:choline dehydrogenase-like flavoprotein